MRVEADRSQIRDYVLALDERFGKPAKDAELVGLEWPPVDQQIQMGPRGTPGDDEARDRAYARARIRPRLPLVMKPLKPTITRANFGPVIIIHRARIASTSSTDPPGAQLPRRDRTGAVPDADRALAHRRHAAESLVAPARLRLGKGAGADPARARQPARHALDGADASGVGIHGTPDSASIGYSASHGCIRMLIPEATWLFDHVRIGTSVLIVPD